MEFVPALAIVPLMFKVVDFLRYAKNRDANGVFTQLIAWIAGVVVLLLVAQSTWASTITLAGVSLHRLGFWSSVFAGVVMSSAASTLADLRKTFDNSNSAAIPTLLPTGPVPPSRDVG